MSEQLQKDLEQSQQENQQLKSQVKGMTANAQALREIISELTESNGVARTNLILATQAYQETVKMKELGDGFLVSLNHKLADLERTNEQLLAGYNEAQLKLSELSQPSEEQNEQAAA